MSNTISVLEYCVKIYIELEEIIRVGVAATFPITSSRPFVSYECVFYEIHSNMDSATQHY